MVSIGNVASRASAGAAPEGARKGRARVVVVGGMLPSSSVFRFWDGCPLALQPGGRGAWLSFRPGGSNLVEEVRKGCSALSLSREGAFVFRPFFFCWGGSPSVQHRPRVTYSGTAKGPLLGGSADCIRA